MPRLLALAVFLVAPMALAQPTVHAVPFGSAGNAVELEVAAPDALGELTVTVAQAPAWLRFAAPVVPAVAGAEGSLVARLAFDVRPEAAVGEVVEVILEVREDGAVMARHAVWLAVSAPPLALGAPRPNPSRGRTVVPFTVAEAGPVRVSVVDVLGREVAVLAEGPREAGAHHAEVRAKTLAAGVYLVRLVAGAEAQTRALTVVR